MNFALTAYDRPGALPLRLEVRPAHLDYLRAIAANIVFAGPVLDAEGKPCGSIIVYEAEDLAAAQKLVNDDPYSHAGLFERVELKGYRVVVKDGVVAA
ncbi:YciI family protein [Ancylobacter oerskovii]|uniref:YciI family protein n=1 Tax=Ancylobacter oerskovii TaxID=459519 RepID=A0ABW4YZC7_9HYPH|nr:YciI family protein [Ancylobacter oerskovii]MBS7543972.1 YciI family protein [Ancylobacter oerskovii]